MFHFCLFDPVHIFICFLKQTSEICGNRIPGNIQGGPTAADRYIVRLVIQLVKVFQILFDADEKVLWSFGGISREEAVELVTAESATDIVFFCGAPNCLSDGLESKITGLMSKTVVDGLEFIQIQYQCMQVRKEGTGFQ